MDAGGGVAAEEEEDGGHNERTDSNSQARLLGVTR